MSGRSRSSSRVVRHVLATCAVAACVCVVAAATGHGGNAPLILLAAPVVGATDALAAKWARNNDRRS